MSCWFWHNWVLESSFKAIHTGEIFLGKVHIHPFKEHGYIKIMRCKDCGDKKAFFVNDENEESQVSIFTSEELVRSINSNPKLALEYDFLTYLDKHK